MTMTNADEITIDPPTMPEVYNWHEPRRISGITDFPKDDDFVLHNGARIFSYLMQTAAPIIKHYHGDLFHDAMKLAKMLSEWDRETRINFRWEVDDCGSWFAFDGGREFKFDCSIFVERNSVKFTMTRVKEG